MTWYKTGAAVVVLVTFLVSITLIINLEYVSAGFKLQDTNAIEGKGESILIEYDASDKTGTYPSGKIQEKLQQLERIIKRASLHVRGTKTSNELRKAYNLLNEIMQSFPKRDSRPWRQSFEPSTVCPEEYLDKRKNPRQSWFNIKKCSHGKSLGELVTVIIHLNYTELVGERLSVLLNSIHTEYNDVQVILANTSELLTHDEETANVKIVTASKASDGEVLNKLVKQVKTPYVLIARNIEMLTHDARLDRLIREIETQQVPVAAGAVRDPNGHWEMGCHQTVMRNYSLKYFTGYDESFHECVFCDFASGPFLTSVKTIERFQFAKIQESMGLFEDWFLRLTEKNIETMLCPDSMFFTTHRHEADKWPALMIKWNLVEIDTPGGQTITSECGDNLLNSQRAVALSPCKMKANADTTNTMMELCEKHSLICELNAGNVLGAVKFGHVLPWEKDVDINVLSANFTAYREFLSKVYQVTPYKKDCDSRFYCAYSGKWKMDVCERNSLDSENLIAAGIKPTRLLYDGHWLVAPRNPGLFLRDKYGREIFQHALHYLDTHTSSAAAYKPNKFLPCQTPGMHSCLDRYNGDGNLQFKHIMP